MARTRDAEVVEMLFPTSDRADGRVGLRLQAAQRLLGQVLLLQVGQGVRVQRVGDVAGVVWPTEMSMSQARNCACSNGWVTWPW